MAGVMDEEAMAIKETLAALCCLFVLVAQATVAWADSCGEVLPGASMEGYSGQYGGYDPDGKCHVRDVSKAVCDKVSGYFRKDRGAGYTRCSFEPPSSRASREPDRGADAEEWRRQRDKFDEERRRLERAPDEAGPKEQLDIGDLLRSIPIQPRATEDDPVLKVMEDLRKRMDREAEIHRQAKEKRDEALKRKLTVHVDTEAAPSGCLSWWHDKGKAVITGDMARCVVVWSYCNVGLKVTLFGTRTKQSMRDGKYGLNVYCPNNSGDILDYVGTCAAEDQACAARIKAKGDALAAITP